MKTQALRITIGAYAEDQWHVAIVADTYVHGVMADSELVTIRWCTGADVSRLVIRALDQLEASELQRLRT